MTIQRPKCSERKCVNFNGLRIGIEGELIMLCDAFPNGIPDEISYGDNPHDTIHPEQEGELVYEKRPNIASIYSEEI